MGHLISARSFRLGISLEWMDVWYFKNRQSYIIILFTCFRLRYYLLSYLYSKKRDRSNFIYSHVEFVRKSKFININIFFYNSIVKNIFSLFSSNIYKFISKGIYSAFLYNIN